MDGRVCAAVVVVIALSGCLGVVGDGAFGDGWEGDPNNHWQSEVLTVSYDSPADDDREYEPLVHETLVYWTENSEQYAGFDVGYRLAESGEDADIHVEFVEEVTDCGAGSGDHTAGCAPVLADAEQVDRPVEVQVRTGLSDESTRQVLKHELGHTLGLEHNDEPQEIMQPQIELTTTPKTNATDRELPWRSDDLVVYTDLGAVPDGDHDHVERQIGAALHYYMDGADGTVPENLTFFMAGSPENADIVIEYTESDECRSGSGSCGTLGGDDLDGDGAIDYYTRLDIVLVDLNPEVTAWHVGRWLGRGFGHETDADFPESLEQTADREERRSAWWD